LLIAENVHMQAQINKRMCNKNFPNQKNSKIIYIIFLTVISMNKKYKVFFRLMITYISTGVKTSSWKINFCYFIISILNCLKLFDKTPTIILIHHNYTRYINVIFYIFIHRRNCFNMRYLYIFIIITVINYYISIVITIIVFNTKMFKYFKTIGDKKLLFTKTILYWIILIIS